VALRTSTFAQENLLSRQFLLGCLPGIELPSGPSFGVAGKSMMFCICAIIGT
jgi:hypothetical protein